MLKDKINEVLITEEEISAAVARLGARISADYEGKNPLFVVVLKGSMVFAADLMRKITVELELDFMQASSYGSGTVHNELKIKKDLGADVSGREVILVEDIVDSGRTLSLVKKMLEERNAADVKICSLLSKPSRREVDVKIDYLGMEIPDEFVVGYGLDVAEKYRNLPYIGIYAG